MGVKLGVSGLGSFAQTFIPVFQAHPMVDVVKGADPLPDRRQLAADSFQIETCETQEQLLADDELNAIAIFTQRWLHGPQAVRALDAGKAVYSAVPAAITVDEMQAILGAVERNKGIYMLGETSYYYPSAIFVRSKARSYELGDFVYAEGEYYHDMEHGFYPPYQGSNGPEWKRFASFPPMLYPSHSVSMIVGTVGETLTSVSCLGYTDHHPDGIFDRSLSEWNNDFSNETALFRTSGGGMCRINEFRRVAYGLEPSVRLNMYGTKGCFEQDGNGELWTTHDRRMEDITERLRCYDPSKALRPHVAVEGAQQDFHSGLSSVHPSYRLPEELRSFPTGHFGSHAFLVDDFIRAYESKSLPPNHAWAAARYCVPGIVAHESAKRHGERLSIPDLGDPPDHWNTLEVATE